MKIIAFIKKDIYIMLSYRFKLILQFFAFFLSLVFLYYISKTFSGNISPYLKEYKGDYFSYALIGIAISSFVSVGLHSFSNDIRSSQIQGTLEALMCTPTSIYIILLGNSMWSFLSSFITSILLLILGVVFFNFNITLMIVFFSLLVLSLVFIAFLLVGMLSASFIMVFKQGNPINIIFGYSSYFFGGVIFPVEVLPKPFQMISLILPITHGVNALRDLLLSNKSITDVSEVILRLIIFIIIIAPISLITFHMAIKRAKKDGSLVQY